MSRRDDFVYLEDMLVYSLRVKRYAVGHTRGDLETDEIFGFGMLKCLEIIGEAANRVSHERKAQFPQIPWNKIVGLRHKLVHDYTGIDFDVIWMTISQSVPELIELLKPIVGDIPELERE